jgi:hypothetical protein
MARLSDVVCSWALNQDLDEDNHVREAAEEIMQYVEDVRPGDGEKKTEWVMHVLGADDVIPCAGEFDALRRANQHNIAFATMVAADPSPNAPYCVAVAELA